jgi:hypothetical protein
MCSRLHASRCRLRFVTPPGRPHHPPQPLLTSARAAGRGAKKWRNPPVQPRFGGHNLRVSSRAQRALSRAARNRKEHASRRRCGRDPFCACSSKTNPPRLAPLRARRFCPPPAVRAVRGVGTGSQRLRSARGKFRLRATAGNSTRPRRSSEYRLPSGSRSCT